MRALGSTAGVVLGFVALCSAAAAHPVDEIVQGAYLTLAPGEVRLELDLTPGTDVAAAVLAAIDSNADLAISAEEANAFAMGVLAVSTLSVDGVALAWTLEVIEMPDYQTIAMAGAVIEILAVAERQDQEGSHQLTYRNIYRPVKSQSTANIFLQPADGWQYAVTAQHRADNGQTLSVDYTATRQ